MQYIHIYLYIYSLREDTLNRIAYDTRVSRDIRTSRGMFIFPTPNVRHDNLCVCVWWNENNDGGGKSHDATKPYVLAKHTRQKQQRRRQWMTTTAITARPYFATVRLHLIWMVWWSNKYVIAVVMRARRRSPRPRRSATRIVVYNIVLCVVLCESDPWLKSISPI